MVRLVLRSGFHAVGGGDPPDRALRRAHHPRLPLTGAFLANDSRRMRHCEDPRARLAGTRQSRTATAASDLRAGITSRSARTCETSMAVLRPKRDRAMG